MKRLLFLFILLISSVGAFALVPGAGFVPDKPSGCPPLVVNFTDTSSIGVTSWKWDFGNGNTSLLQNPSATFTKSGTYKVKLVVSDGQYYDSTTQIITVYNTPIANFTVDKPSACFYDTLHFTSTTVLGDASITDFGWGFGNGLAVSAKGNVTYKYDQVGAYSITLVVQDSNKCSSSKTINNFVHVWPQPTAAYTASPTSSCLPNQLVKFTNNSTGVGLKYFWDLDGGGIVNTTNPTHTYNDQKYVTSLTVVDTNGCQNTATQLITSAHPSADFTASKYLACTGEKIQFTNISNFTGTTYSWDFGDGTTSNVANPAKTYSASGIYSVSFMISNGSCTDSTNKPNLINIREGAKLPEVTLEADTTETCTPPLKVNFTNVTSPDIVGYQWSFGDGQGSNEPNPTNIYTKSGSFTVSLTVMDTSGCMKTATFPNLISTSGPNVDFGFSVNCPNTPGFFNNKAPGTVTCVWDFGDGDSSKLFSPFHTYKKMGTYTVTLNTTSITGCAKAKTKQITIDSVYVDFKVNATYSPCPPFVALFKNTSKNGAFAYKWDFGDGVTDTTANPTHIYFYPGLYTVKLLGTTKAGCTDTVIYKDLINVQGPTATFTVAPTTGCLPLKVDFTATPSANTKAIWSDLGDGTVIEDTLQYSHTYTDERIYHPQFVLTDHVGCTVSYPLDSITTHAIPSLSVHDTSICEGTVLNMNLASNANTYSWSPPNFVDCATCGRVKISSPDTITYHVTGISKFGCRTEEQTLTVNVEPLPQLTDAKVVNLCKNDTIPLSVGNNAARISWSPVLFIDNDTSFQPLFFPQKSMSYTATGFNTLGCTATAHAYFNIQDKLDISLPDTINTCEFTKVPLSVQVAFSSDLGTYYAWTPMQYLDNAKIQSPVASMTKRSVDFQVIASSGHCIPDTATVRVNVIPTPVMEVSEGVKTTTLAEIPLHASSREELSYRWYAKDKLSCDDCRNTVLYPTTSQLVIVEGSNEYGCVVRDSVPIEVQGCNPDAIFMPNTFTPNEDGVNDQFLIRSNALTSLSYFRVYDQWGHLVFETKQMDKGWDGSSEGKPANTGVYVYVLEGKCANGSDVMKSGNVTAIR